MKLLFEDLAKTQFTSARVQKLKNWVEHADSARKSGNLDKFANQYDKAEELITFYTFAPMLLRQDKLEMVNDVLKLAKINKPAIGELSLTIEKPLPCPEGYLSWLKDEALKINPVRYVREQAVNHQKRNKTLETATHVDAVIKTGNFVIFVEMKFTSDISTDTTFNPYRNQLARLIDVGTEIARTQGKKLIVLLATPSGLFRNKSRLYFYKIQDYSSSAEIQKDIVWRKQEEIEKHVLAVKWISLEELIKILYKGLGHADKEEAMVFFRERNLV